MRYNGGGLRKKSLGQEEKSQDGGCVEWTDVNKWWPYK